MDPSFKDYFDKFNAALDEFRSNLRTNSTAVKSTPPRSTSWSPGARIWRRGSRRSGLAVTTLQQEHASTSTALGEEVIGEPFTTTLPATTDSHIGTRTGAIGASHGSDDHDDAFLYRQQVPVHAPVPLPGTSQFPFQSPVSVPFPFAYASQLLIGLVQAHPLICFPQFTGENPRLWKTLCEQYFQMFNIHSLFWVPMASLNFLGSASIWLQSIQKKLAGFDWESFSSLLCTRFGRDRHQLLIR